MKYNDADGRDEREEQPAKRSRIKNMCCGVCACAAHSFMHVRKYSAIVEKKEAKQEKKRIIIIIITSIIPFYLCLPFPYRSSSHYFFFFFFRSAFGLQVLRGCFCCLAVFSHSLFRFYFSLLQLLSISGVCNRLEHIFIRFGIRWMCVRVCSCG